uniref:Uncharacterized protein n=1 Tax=Rhizophora mucronata TaxID=61149 RepID=A0A2P2QM58_RHIMU
MATCSWRFAAKFLRICAFEFLNLELCYMIEAKYWEL